MDWFKRAKRGLIPQKKKDMPDGLWLKCEGCKEIIYRKALEQNLNVCPKCGFHFTVRSSNYIKILLDEGTFEEFNTYMRSADPLKFRDTKRYADRIKDATKNTGMNEAVRTGLGQINGIPVVFAVMDFSFIGGSMGSVVGEKVARAIDVALEKRFPLIIVCTSGGARMQEGVLSLMQMAKTASRLGELADAGILYISILTNPTFAGVAASYGMLGDVIIAEPGALIGFTGPRVIKQTIGEELPQGFQRSEFLLKHGFIDAIFPRVEMKEKLAEILGFFSDEKNGK